MSELESDVRIQKGLKRYQNTKGLKTDTGESERIPEKDSRERLQMRTPEKDSRKGFRIWIKNYRAILTN